MISGGQSNCAGRGHSPISNELIQCKKDCVQFSCCFLKVANKRSLVQIQSNPHVDLSISASYRRRKIFLFQNLLSFFEALVRLKFFTVCRHIKIFSFIIRQAPHLLVVNEIDANVLYSLVYSLPNIFPTS